MTYEIQSKSDFQVGATLTVRLPEEDLDRKALRTIQFELPGFLLPFRYRFVDGEVELTYQIGNHSKIAYLFGNRSPSEYADMWFGLMQPLLDCGDWFMRPESFVLLPDHIYCYKSIHAIRFVYIPSLRPCSDAQSLKVLVTEIAKMNHVTDVNLENKVIWAIQDFNIHSFLQLIKENCAGKQTPTREPERQAAPMPANEAVVQAAPHVPQPVEQRVAAPQNQEKSMPAQQEKAGLDDDIQIQFSSKGKPEKERKSKGGFFGFKREKKAKDPGKRKNKKAAHQDIIGGAAAQPYQPQQFTPSPVNVCEHPFDDSDNVTQLDMSDDGGTGFRYVGSGELPPLILPCLEINGVFTIGRFDESVGVRQSSFEFPKKTKAVSRRHAAVERRADGYYIVDLASSAGTFLNGHKLPPNVPFRLESGSRVSFGFSGADYVWEERDI